MSAPEDRVTQALREIVEFGAAEPWELSPADARREARRRPVAVIAAHLGATTNPSRGRQPGAWSHRVMVIAVAALILAVFFVPLPHLSLFDRLSHGRIASPTSVPSTIPPSTIAPSTTVSSTTQPRTASGKIAVVAQLPKGFSFDGCDSPPVLAGTGREVVALLQTTGNCPPQPLTLARISLPSGRVVLGPKVAGVANLFAGPTGQVFMLNLSGGPIGHIELWRISDTLKPTPLLRLPFPEKTAVDGSYTDPALAVAVVPNEDRAWVADGQHIELVNLGDGDLIATRAAPRGIAGNVTGLALVSPGGPLYLTFCERRPGSPAYDPFLACGVVGEIDPVTWTVTAKRWYGGPVSYGRYGVVATPAGAWLSEGGGGNGAGMDFFSSAGLHRTRVTEALGSLFLLATGDVVWADLGGGGLISCFDVSASGSVTETTVVGQTSSLLGPGSPFGIESQRHSLLVASGVNLLATPVPRACASNGG